MTKEKMVDGITNSVDMSLSKLQEFMIRHGRQEYCSP